MIHFLSQSLLKIFAVLKFFGKWLQKIIFYKHYQISHRHYLKRKYKNNWQKLTDYISYKLILEDVYCNDTFPISKLILKPSTFNNNDILEVNLSFIAISGEVHHVQNITHYFDTDNIAVFKLTNIPLKEFDVINQRTSYNKYFFRINKIILNEKEVEKNIKSLTYYPFYSGDINEDFINKWGGYWNLNLYRRAKKELFIAIAASLLEDTLLLHHPLSNESIYLKIRRFTAKILLKDVFLNIIFWSSVILGIARVTHEGTLASKYLSVDRCRRFLKVHHLKFRA